MLFVLHAFEINFYKIVLEENPNKVLGYTNKSFAHELEKSMQHIMGINCSIYHRVYPNAFCDIYIHDTATYLSTMAPVLAGAKTFGDISIWLGITITSLMPFSKPTTNPDESSMTTPAK